MPVAFFQIPLSVQPGESGYAGLVPPQAVAGLNYRFVIVKEGGEEAIVQIDAPDAELKQVAADAKCKKLTAKQMEALRKSYPPPKLKRKLRAPVQSRETGEAAAKGPPAVDQPDSMLTNTFQTVRSGFYLIDVPVLAPPSE